MKKPHPIDVYFGKRLRLRRTPLGITQERLAEGLNISFQQVQKYENGTNRVSASRIQAISKLLDVPPEFFFKEAPKRGHAKATERRPFVFAGGQIISWHERWSCNREGSFATRMYCSPSIGARIGP
jgi:transcriptional regulator with XRE-family HTH domain